MSAGRRRFVSFEGGEGVGKSTQLRRLASLLAREGLDVLVTREPGGTPSAERIRALLLDPALDCAPDAEILLHFAARADHLDRAVMPALARGATVLCDRFADSTLAYQHFGAGADRSLIDGLTARLPIMPNLTFVLVAEASIRRRRLAGRAGQADRYERRDDAFHARVAHGFDQILAANPDRCVRIDANGDEDSVAALVHAAWTRRA